MSRRQGGTTTSPLGEVWLHQQLIQTSRWSKPSKQESRDIRQQFSGSPDDLYVLVGCAILFSGLIKSPTPGLDQEIFSSVLRTTPSSIRMLTQALTDAGT
ncbi:hypothetical protein N657DRAFT_643106 [Parathielavia appendiculata]|uniref:Uncharacterized protein n=1 Tax=Parathielavia appendiculata TaxID=2587402 RepID=A0AAN6U541_9PEZI|nr:hypothetical protein N657DRAFT_643106 [Parathielavia appendiculata]